MKRDCIIHRAISVYEGMTQVGSILIWKANNIVMCSNRVAKLVISHSVRFFLVIFHQNMEEIQAQEYADYGVYKGHNRQ